MKLPLLLSVLVSTTFAATTEDLYGSWRLISYSRTIAATGEVVEPFGKTPRGVLTYTRDGRMHAVLAKDVRPKTVPAALTDRERLELQRTVTAYTGTFSFDGSVVTHRVDLAADESWIGTDQIRHAKLEDRRLVITTPQQSSPFDGRNGVAVLIWEKMVPSQSLRLQP